MDEYEIRLMLGGINGRCINVIYTHGYPYDLIEELAFDVICTIGNRIYIDAGDDD